MTCVNKLLVWLSTWPALGRTRKHHVWQYPLYNRWPLIVATNTLVAALLRDVVSMEPTTAGWVMAAFQSLPKWIYKMKRINALNVFPSFPRMLPPEAWPIKNLSIGAQWFFCTWHMDFFISTAYQRRESLAGDRIDFSLPTGCLLHLIMIPLCCWFGLFVLISQNNSDFWFFHISCLSCISAGVDL